MIIGWTLIFILALFVLIKGSDWFLSSAEKIGYKIGLSPFVIGVVIVGIGTSLPELISSLFAVFAGTTEIVVANTIGSNIANILLVIGLSALVGKKLQASKDLIDLELPLLASSTAVFGIIAWDKIISFPEALILVAGFVLYMAYIITTPEDDKIKTESVSAQKTPRKKTVISIRDIIVLIIGVAGLVFGAQYLIESVISLSTLLGLGAGVISITAVAVGTSLPELLVSIKAARQGKSEVALGNIFGSNAFNILLVVGFPGLFSTIKLDDPTFYIGLPFLFIATFLFIISGISRKIHSWEGGLYLALYILFIAKLFELF